MKSIYLLFTTLVLTAFIIQPSFAKAEKVTCYKYQKRKGTIKEKQKKKCKGKWKATRDEALTDVAAAKEKCEKKKKRSWIVSEGNVGKCEKKSIQKVTCYKYQKRKGTIKEKQKKKCKGKWKANIDEIKSEITKQKQKCEKKKNKAWEEIPGSSVAGITLGKCTKIKRANKLLPKGKVKKCKKVLTKVTSKGVNLGQYSKTYREHPNNYCEKINIGQFQNLKKLHKCIKKVEKANKKRKKKKLSPDSRATLDIFFSFKQRNGKVPKFKCNKQKLKQYANGNLFPKEQPQENVTDPVVVNPTKQEPKGDTPVKESAEKLAEEATKNAANELIKKKNAPFDLNKTKFSKVFDVFVKSEKQKITIPVSCSGKSKNITLTKWGLPYSYKMTLQYDSKTFKYGYYMDDHVVRRKCVKAHINLFCKDYYEKVKSIVASPACAKMGSAKSH